MSLPAKYPPAVTPANWNAMVDRVNGYTSSGTFISPYNYVISSDDTYYYASNAFQTIYGGADAAGGVDGTDGSAVLQATVDAVRGTVNHSLTGTSARKIASGSIFIRDSLDLESPIDLADVSHLIIKGNMSKINLKMDDDVIFDLTNSSNVLFDDLYFDFNTGYTPAVGFLLARDISGTSCEWIRFRRCFFDNIVNGTLSNCIIYNYASELGSLENCDLRHTVDAIKLTAYNIDSVTSPNKTIYNAGISCRGFNFTNTAFLKANETLTSANSVTFESAGESLFLGCFFYAHEDEDNYAFYFDFTNDGIYTLNVYGCKFEGKVLKTNTGESSCNLLGMHFRDNYFSVPSASYDYFDCDQVSNNLTRCIFEGNYFNYVASPDYIMKFLNVYDSTLNFRQCGTSEPKITISGDITLTNITMHESTNLDLSGATWKDKNIVQYINTYGGGTFNSGQNTGTGSEQTIPHGLHRIPQRIWFGNYAEADTMPRVSNDADATNIYITAPLGQFYYWFALAI